MALNLQNSIASRQDLKALILDVRTYATWYGQAAVKARLTNDNLAPLPNLSEAAIGLINTWNQQQPISQASLDALLAELEKYAATAAAITITLAAPAPGSVKQSLLAWCRANIAPNILVDFRFNSTLLGGMVVQYGSHVYDWSFRRQILANRDKFPEILRHV